MGTFAFGTRVGTQDVGGNVGHTKMAVLLSHEWSLILEKTDSSVASSSIVQYVLASTFTSSLR
jgi:hypothetical protein